MKARALHALVIALAAPLFAAVPATPQRLETAEAPLHSGARWSAIVPSNLNGELLLHSRGYSAEAGPPEPAPDAYREALLSAGFLS
jgi:hypothetical protein